MSISKKLKDLIVAFGGAQSAAAIPGTRIDTLIGTLAQHLSSNGSPALSNVHFPVTGTSGDGGAITATTTAKFADIKAAVLAGKTVIADVTVNGMTMFMPVRKKQPATNPTALAFAIELNMADSGETPAPTLIQAVFTADGITVTSVAVAVAT